jgi:hypothetical protein
MTSFRVLVTGGYGFFGRRLVERLAAWRGLHIVVAGRSLQQGQALVDTLAPRATATLEAVELDAQSAGIDAELRRTSPHVVVHTCGPFQGQDHRVARACIRAGAHCIDLADGREFVEGIRVLDEAARAAGLVVLSGASSVPALSSAAVDELACGLATLHHIDIGISPGNRTERGLSTVKAILTYCGKALPGGAGARHGWSGHWRHVYPAPIGERLLSPCDVPDLTLLPSRYAGRPEVRFGAGLELRFLHRGMNAMALLARKGWVADWSAHARWLKRLGDLFIGWGSDAGGMHVTVCGTTCEGVLRERTWHLSATGGDGPYVPTLAAAALIRQLRDGRTDWCGAQPCVGLLALKDFERECQGLRIRMQEEPEERREPL